MATKIQIKKEEILPPVEEVITEEKEEATVLVLKKRIPKNILKQLAVESDPLLGLEFLQPALKILLHRVVL